jgi:hypothetical protein
MSVCCLWGIGASTILLHIVNTKITILEGFGSGKGLRVICQSQVVPENWCRSSSADRCLLSESICRPAKSLSFFCILLPSHYRSLGGMQHTSESAQLSRCSIH